MVMSDKTNRRSLPENCSKNTVTNASSTRQQASHTSCSFKLSGEPSPPMPSTTKSTPGSAAAATATAIAATVAAAVASSIELAARSTEPSSSADGLSASGATTTTTTTTSDASTLGSLNASIPSSSSLSSQSVRTTAAAAATAAALSDSVVAATSAATAVQKPTGKKKQKHRHHRFHQLFPSIAIDEHVISTYSCAYTKSLTLYQGVMFLTDNYVCFYSKLLTHELILKLTHINAVTKTMHALIFPTGLRIDTQNSSYSFTSFRSRSSTIDSITSLLNQSRQRQIEQLLSEQAKYSSDASTTMSTAAGVDTSASSRSGQSSVNTLQDEKAAAAAKRDADNASLNSAEVAPAPVLLDTSDVKDEDEEEEEEDDDEGDDDEAATATAAVARAQQENNKTVVSSVANTKRAPVSCSNGRKKNNSGSSINSSNSASSGYYSSSTYASKTSYYLDCNLGQNRVLVSVRHKRTLLEKVKLLLGLLIPGFFDMSRIDALLPICFVMCVLLLLNAFMLLNKVNQVDDLFAELLAI